VISAHTAPADSLPEALRGAAPGLCSHDARGVAARLAPFVARMRQDAHPQHSRASVDAVMAVCRELYGHGRAGEALPLLQALRESCLRAGDKVQVRRATFLCAMAHSDAGDLVGAIEHYVEALRIAAAQEDRAEMALVWCNIGAAFGRYGRDELAVRCQQRCLELLEPVVAISPVRRNALSNLAANCYVLGRVDEGIRYGELALAEAVEGEDPYASILLRRNLARLLLARGRVDEAEEHVAAALVLAEAARTPRASIAAEVTRAAHDLATGRSDFALTRIDRALARARAVPAALRDALACAVRAEEAAGFPARALMRLQELTDHVYAHAVKRTRKVIELAGLDASEPAAEAQQVLARERLVNRLDPPAPPPAWPALRRLAAGAVLGMDPSGWHGVRVGTLVKALALAWGCAPLQALELGLAAELHDIGMTSVPAPILGKAGPLNEGERTLVQKHTEAGAAMLMDEPHPRLLLARDIARYHHARWDGQGYPDRVAGDAIPLGARMCAIADAYDAMVCGLGRPAVTMAEALGELRNCAGKQFDPELVSCFDAIVNGELQDLGLDPASDHGMDAFQELVASLREDRGFV
jgi:HD-GYP domain-containing protein (c-di-GMP phosphodiesterase class II)